MVPLRKLRIRESEVHKEEGEGEYDAKPVQDTDWRLC